MDINQLTEEEKAKLFSPKGGSGLDGYETSEEDIIKNKKNGVIYVADFVDGKGKYISVTDQPDYKGEDLSIKISPKICLRVTYLMDSDKIKGIKISKLLNGKLEEIHLSTLSSERILQLLYMFSNLDLKSVANKTLMLDKSIIDKPEELEKFLNLVASDPVGKEKLSEIVGNYDLLQQGDIDNLTQRKSAVELFSGILESKEKFNTYKEKIGVKKNEEVWQRFFKENSWILGSDYVEILDHRNIDEDDITDLLLKSFDGFVDIIELKLPEEQFWTSEINPTAKLTGATMQCAKYILEIERKIDSAKYREKLNGNTLLKPKITLIYGRNLGWEERRKEMYRVLNSTYHNISILTFDHVLERAKRIISN